MPEALWSKWSALHDEIMDLRREIPKQRLAELVGQCSAALERAPPSHEQVALHTLLAMLHYRLREPEKQLVHTRALAEAFPEDVLAARNYAANLIEVRNFTEGIERLELAASLPSPHRSRTLGDLAAAYREVGRWDEAVETLAQSARTADYRSERDLLSLASHSSQLGFGQQALEFFVRYLSVAHGLDVGTRSASEVIREVAEQHPDWLWFATNITALRTQVVQALVLDPILRGAVPWDYFAKEVIPEESTLSALAIYDVMKASADEATRVVLGESDPHGESQ